LAPKPPSSSSSGIAVEWESDNDVLGDQNVTLTWDDASRAVNGVKLPDRGPKTAVFHMAGFREAQSKRRGKISGTHGEIQCNNNFSRAVEAVNNERLTVEQAQMKDVDCTSKDAFTSHAMVFAVEEARISSREARGHRSTVARPKPLAPIAILIITAVFYISESFGP
jgi:hypothetical protein